MGRLYSCAPSTYERRFEAGTAMAHRATACGTLPRVGSSERRRGGRGIVGTFVFIVAVLVAIAFAWYRGRRSTLHRTLRARPILDADAIRQADATRYTLDPQTTREVLRALGAALEVDPGCLRLSDPFDALWDMSPQAGFHQRATFETWVLKRYPRLPETTAAATVGDLIARLQRLPLVR